VIPKRQRLTVAIPAHLVSRFRRRAKRTFPREAYAILLGSRVPQQITIEDLYFPTQSEIESTPEFVRVSEGAWVAARLTADWQGLEVVGDLHSHCYKGKGPVTDCAPSQTDLERFERAYVQGIMSITRLPGGKLRTRCRFWGSGAWGLYRASGVDGNGGQAQFWRFQRTIKDRLRKGARDYGDRSFGRPPAELLDEIMEEIADIPGWGAILYSRAMNDPARAELTALLADSFRLWQRAERLKELL